MPLLDGAVFLSVPLESLTVALAQARDAIGAKTMVMTAVEGVAPLKTVRGSFPSNRSYGAVLDARLFLDADGNAIHRAPGALIAIGRLPGGTIEEAERLVAMFDARGLAASFTPSVLDAAWHRFAGGYDRSALGTSARPASFWQPHEAGQPR